MSAQPRCLDEAAAVALVDDALDERARAACVAHLDACVACRSLVAALYLARTESGAGAVTDTRELALPTSERYELADEIARGGMGRVVRARDRLLDRDVALKLMRASADAARFAREVRITARLQHPAIVPVHDCGLLPSGEVFYAMRLVRGETLAAALGTAVDLDARLSLLTAFERIAEAVAYAHDEGVLHRDLKPHNVLVGPFGETVLLDWGLARERDMPEEPPGSSKTPLAMDEDATRTGAVFGTLGYMAPEQARGEPADERTDVYGLGAMLYHVLAGEPPAVLDDDRDVEAATAARLADLREGGAPAELIAIAARAMAPAPAERYPSARALAEDLGRFRAGDRVGAHAYTPGQHLRRWARRHRIVLASAAVALLAVGVVGALAVVRIAEQRHVAEAERDRANAQRAAAEELVRHVVYDLRAQLEPVGRLDVLASTGTRIIDYYRAVDLPPPPERDAALVRRQNAFQLLGEVAVVGGRADDAWRSFDLAAADIEQVGDRERAADAACRLALRRSDAHQALGDIEQARREVDRCVAITAERHRDTLRWRELRLMALLDASKLALAAGDLPRASEVLVSARGVLEALLEAGAEVAVDKQLAVHRTLGIVVMELGDLAAAREHFARAVAVTRAAGDSPEARRWLALALEPLGDVHARLGELDAGIVALREAVTILEELAARDPDSAYNQALRAGVGTRLARLLYEREPAAGLAEADRVIARAEAGLERVPDDLGLQRALVDMLLFRGQAARADGDLRGARAPLERARVLAAALATASPDELDAALNLAIAEDELAVVLAGLGERRAASALADQNIARLRELAQQLEHPAVRRILGFALVHRVELGGPDARAYLDEAALLLAPLRDQADGDPELASEIATLDAAVATHATP